MLTSDLWTLAERRHICMGEVGNMCAIEWSRKEGCIWFLWKTWTSARRGCNTEEGTVRASLTQSCSHTRAVSAASPSPAYITSLAEVRQNKGHLHRFIIAESSH